MLHSIITNKILHFSNISQNKQQNVRLALTKVLGVVQKHIVFYPTATSISYFYGFGSIAGIFLGIQLVTGIILAMHYQPSALTAFESVLRIVNDVPSGWLLRSLHANGASFFFIAVYTHMGRGLYFGSLFAPRTWVWITGLVIFLLMMGSGFIGYCLPWGQMSLWGATVITNLLSVLIWPLDITIVEWLWGGFTVTGITLNRFFSLHYLLPFVIAALVMVHLYFLHDVSSNNPQGIESYMDLGKVPFYPYFSIKDLAGLFAFCTIYLAIVFFYPSLLGHSDNFIKANPFVTPAHIVPEWYFLPFYAILRSISNKLAGVLAMLISSAFITAIYFTSVIFKHFIFDTEVKRAIPDLPLSKILFWFFIANFLLLGFIGARPIETPYYIVGQLSSIAFFMYFPVSVVLISFETGLIHESANNCGEILTIKSSGLKPHSVFNRFNGAGASFFIGSNKIDLANSTAADLAKTVVDNTIMLAKAQAAALELSRIATERAADVIKAEIAAEKSEATYMALCKVGVLARKHLRTEHVANQHAGAQYEIAKVVNNDPNRASILSQRKLEDATRTVHLEEGRFEHAREVNGGVQELVESALNKATQSRGVHRNVNRISQEASAALEDINLTVGNLKNMVVSSEQSAEAAAAYAASLLGLQTLDYILIGGGVVVVSVLLWYTYHYYYSNLEVQNALKVLELKNLEEAKAESARLVYQGALEAEATALAEIAVLKAALATAKAEALKAALALALYTFLFNVIVLLFFTLAFDYILLLIYYEVMVKDKL